MAYEKQNWACGETITAEKLNHMEEGIEECCGSGGGAEPLILTFAGTTQEEADAALMGNAYLSATWQQINDAFRAGRRIIVITNPILEETLATSITMEIIGVSGATVAGQQGLLDTKLSVQTVFGQDGTAPKLMSFRCDNATDYPATAIMG